MFDFVGNFKESMARISGTDRQGLDFFASFYSNLFSASPEIAEKFKDTNMHVQRNALRSSIPYVLEFFATGKFDANLHKFAQRHSAGERNVSPQLYELWLDVLIATAKDFDDKFNQDIELSWRLVFAPMITLLKFYYDKEIL